MKKSKIKIIALFGKAGSGKDTIQKWLAQYHKDKVHEIISCTTRPPRDYEKDGVDYNFLSVEEFTKQVLNGEMLEATEFRGWFYGTQASALSADKLNIGVFNIAGIEALLESTNIEVLPVLVYASDKTRLMRQLSREQSPDCEEICRRFQTDNQDFAKIEFEPFFIWDNPATTCAYEMRMHFAKNFDRLLEKLSSLEEDD